MKSTGKIEVSYYANVFIVLVIYLSVYLYLKCLLCIFSVSRLKWNVYVLHVHTHVSKYIYDRVNFTKYLRAICQKFATSSSAMISTSKHVLSYGCILLIYICMNFFAS